MKDIWNEICWFVRVKIFMNGILDIPHKIRAMRLKFRRGFSCCDTFGLHANLAKYIYKGLKAFKEDLKKHPSYPPSMTFDDWCSTIDTIIEGFRMIILEDLYLCIYTKKEYEKIDNALSLFSKYFMDLWL